MSVHVRPRVFRDPLGGVGCDLDVSNGPSQEIPPLNKIELVLASEDLDGEEQCEEQFVFFEEGSADVFIK